MARDFPGNSSNFFSVADLPAIDITGTALSLHCWARVDSLAANRVLFAKWGTGGLSTLQYILRVETSGNILGSVGAQGGGANDLVTGTTPLVINQWYPIGMRKNGTGAAALQVFLSGISVGTATSNVTIQNTAETLRLGRSAAGEPHDGALAECAIWDTALSDAEFLSLANYTCPMLIQWPNLAAYWPLRGVTAPEPDLSRNSNNMSLTGTVVGYSHPPVNCQTDVGVAFNYQGRRGIL